MNQHIESAVEEFRETFSVPTSKDNWTPDTYPHPLGIINWLRTTLTKISEEARKEEKAKVADATQHIVALSGDKEKWGDYARGVIEGGFHVKELVLEALATPSESNSDVEVSDNN